MKYILFLLFISCTSLKEKDYNDYCLETANRLVQNTKLMNDLTFQNKPIKFEKLISIEFDAKTLQKCIKHHNE